MRLSIRLFARMRDLHGGDRLEVELADGGTVADLRTAILAAQPAFAEHLASVRIAAALNLVPETHVLRAGDEVALIPPVSGG